MYAQHKSRRWVSVAVVAVVVTSLQIATAQPAAALPALQLVVQGSGFGPNPTKQAVAPCPSGKVVVGGGGEIVGNETRTTVLTSLQPLSAAGIQPARFVASGRALATAGDWSIVAYALCVDTAAMQPYLINETTSPSSTSVFRSGTSRCPAGMVAYSAGGIAPPGFGLQMVRTSGPLDIGRATVRATTNTVNESSRMKTSVVCGPRKDDIAAQVNIVNGSFAGLQCPTGQQIHGAGGGLGLTDGGTNWLRSLRPTLTQQEPRGMTVRMTLQNPGYQTLAHATCASRTS